jgi:hypothetical protein
VSDPDFMYCATRHVFGGTEGVGSRFHLLRSWTRCRLYRGCRVPFSTLTLPDSFAAVSRVSDPVFIFCTPRLIFDGTEGVGSRFNVLRVRTHFQRYRGRRVSFSYFARPDSFSTVPRTSGPVFIFCAPDSFSVVPRASGPVFMFHAPGLNFGGTDGVGSRFDVSSARTRFRRF